MLLSAVSLFFDTNSADFCQNHIQRSSECCVLPSHVSFSDGFAADQPEFHSAFGKFGKSSALIAKAHGWTSGARCVLCSISMLCQNRARISGVELLPLRWDRKREMLNRLTRHQSNDRKKKKHPQLRDRTGKSSCSLANQ